MPEYLAPGLFIEEIDSGSKPIEGVGTNTAAFPGGQHKRHQTHPFGTSAWHQHE